jgi:hypothetical protein
MIPRLLTSRADYLAVVRGLWKLHGLRAAGRQDSPEADTVRDEMDIPWQGLTQLEKEQVNRLSEYLYSITDP